MEQRRLGNSGLKVPMLSFGAATFGGGNEFFRTWGSTGIAEASRMIAMCIDAGVNFFDTADVYSRGLSEEILGAALAGRREEVLISTKATSPMGPRPNDGGSSRKVLIKACDDSLRRLGTDYIDVYYMHEFDGSTPVEETLRSLDDLVTAGKIRYPACSNFAGWELMKSLAIADRYGWARYVSHQVAYSLAVRDYEWELMPLGLDQGVGATVWSPLGGSALTGKVRRGQELPADSRVGQTAALPAAVERIYAIVDVLDVIALETGATVSQVALAWVLAQPGVSTVVIGARTETQLRENLAVASIRLDVDQIRRLDDASATPKPFPFSHQEIYPQFAPQRWDDWRTETEPPNNP